MTHVHIDSLKESFDRASRVGHKETVFSVDGQKIGIRTLTSKEQNEAQNKARPLFEEAQEKDDLPSWQKWVRTNKIELLSRAIIQIGEANLRQVDYIETNERDEATGKLIRKPKPLVLRDFLENMNSKMLDVCFRKFRENAQAAEEELLDQVEFRSGDIDEKIKQKESELEELREMKEKRADDPSIEDDRFVEEALSEDDLKDQFYSPSPEEMTEDDLEKIREAEDETFERVENGDDPGSRSREPDLEQDASEQGSRSQPDRSNSQNAQYVDEEGEPLKGEELQKAQMEDELYRQKMKEQERHKRNQGRPQESRQKGREPMNKQDAHIEEGSLPDEGQNEFVRNAQKARNPVDEESLDIADAFDQGPEKLGKSTESSIPAKKRSIDDLKRDDDES
jgi:hypothetical protein